MPDWGALYREHVADVSALASGLTDEQLATTVAATPDWTVREVYAHMAGGASDGLTGRMDGAPTPEWTDRHVGERRDRPVAELVAELQSNEDAVAGSLDGTQFPAAVFDISVHHADLHEALGKPQLAEHLWLPVLDAMRPRLDARLLESAPPYEVYRGLFSRRSRAQMQGWTSPLSAEELDELCIFGPRDDDQPVPPGTHSLMASYTVNDDAVARCRELIKAKQYVLDSDWGDVQPDAEAQNGYLERHAWPDYAAWHLGLTVGANDETKARHAFVYGDFRRVHRTGLIACVYRASEWRHKAVELAAHDLLQQLDQTAGIS